MEREIVVSLKLDPSDFTKGAEVAEKELGTINQQLVKMEDELRNLSKETGQEVAKKSFDTLNQAIEKNVLSIQDLGVAADNYKNIAIAAGTTTPLGREALEKAAEMERRLDGVNREVAQLAEGGRALNSAMALGTGVLAGWSAYQGIAALTGTENEKLQETFIKLQAAQAALMGVKELSISLSKQGILYKTLEAGATKGLAIATTAYNVVVGASTGLMKAFRIAMASTGIGLVVVGVGLLVANFDKLLDVGKSVINWFAGLGEYVARLVEWYNELGVVGKAVATVIAAPIVLAVEAYQWFFGEVEKGTADIMAQEKRLAEQRKKRAKELKQIRDEELKSMREIRVQEMTYYNRRQTAYDLEIERMEAVGKNSNSLKLKKLEDIKDELKAQLEFIQNSTKAWEEYYENLRVNRGESKDEFIANLKKQGVDLEEQRKKRKGMMKDLENQIYSSESKILEFKRNIREKNAAEYKKRRDEEIQMEKEKQKALEDLLNEADQMLDEAEAERKAKRLKAAQDERDEIDKEATKLLEAQIKVNKDLAEWERQQRLDDFQIRMDDLKKQFQEELALFEGNEEMKVRLTEQYNSVIASIQQEADEADNLRQEEQLQIKLDNINRILDEANQALDALAQITQIANEIGDRRIERVREESDEQIAIVQARTKKELDNDNLTADQKAAIEQKSAMMEFRIKQQSAIEQDKIAKRQFERNKAISLLEIGINTATAIVKGIAQFGPPPSPLGIAAIATAGGLGIAQAALVASSKFQGSAGGIAPPSFTIPRVDTGGTSGGGNDNTGGTGPQNNTTTDTDNLVNPPPIIISQVEINKVQNELALISDISVL